MQSFKQLVLESAKKKEETIQTILKMWTQSVDVENIIRHTGKSQAFIKKVLKDAGKKGWEEL